MFKKIILFLIISIIFLCHATSALAAKITNVSFDNSDNMIFIATNGHDLNCNNLEIKPVKLKNPDRVYFDIPDAILTNGNQSFLFRNSNIKQVKIAQFSTNPNIVRTVIYYDKNFKPDDIKFYCTANNSITAVLSEKYGTDNNGIAIYRTQINKNNNIYEKTVYAPEKNANKITNNLPEAPSNTTNVEALDQIQKALSLYTTSPEQPFSLTLDREFELKSNYFLKQINIKRGNALISGVGNLELQTPFVLTNPSRLIIDLPNTIVAQELRNKEFDLTETDKIKIGQFEQSKARIVITTQTPEKYLSIFSIGTQSILIAHENRMTGLKFAEKNTKLTSLKSTSSSENIEEFKINFSEPIVPAIKKTKEKFELLIFNIDIFDLYGLKKAAKETKLQELSIEQAGTNCLKFIFPINSSTEINVYENINNKQLELQFTLPKIEIKKDNKTNKNKSKKIIVIDAGHGGNDVGALQGNIYEKDINLPIALKTAEILKDKGYKVLLTRKNDKTLSLQERVDYTIENKADIFVSIHANSCAKPEISGIETHYYKNIDYELAQSIHKSMTKHINTEDRGLFKSKFYVINHNEIPSVLLEIGYMTNSKELAEIQSIKRQDNTAKAIAEGIINYLSRK